MISGYSYPERVANSAMELTLYKTFARYHISIDVITPTPIRGISNAEHEKYKHVTEEDLYNGWIKIHRYKLGKEKETIAKRASRYIRGAIKAYFKGISYKQSELIYSVSTPPIQGIVCGLIKKKLKIPFVYYLCDVFPDSMVHGGLTHKGSLVWRIGRIIENYIYKKADKIVVINHDFKKNLLAKGVSEDKIGIVYNWIDPNLVLPIPRIDNKLFDDYSLDRDGFYISYAGNLGTAQDVNILVDAAEMLRGEKINFVIFGNGVEEGSIRRKIERLGLTNIHMFPMQPSPRISEVYSLGNASFVSCKPGFGGVGMPSKTWSIMSAGTPVLLCFDRDTELEEIVIDNNCGVFSVAGDVYGLAETIRSLYRMDPTNLRRLGDNGRNFVINNMSAEICTDKLVEIFASVCKKTIHNNEDYNH
jgi:glycosyltransferase involved in cell wall biosynthesis